MNPRDMTDAQLRAKLAGPWAFARPEPVAKDAATPRLADGVSGPTRTPPPGMDPATTGTRSRSRREEPDMGYPGSMTPAEWRDEIA